MGLAVRRGSWRDFGDATRDIVVAAKSVQFETSVCTGRESLIPDLKDLLRNDNKDFQ